MHHLSFLFACTGFRFSHDIWGAEQLTLILSMQSAVLDARTHDSLAKAVTAAGGSTVTRALASSAHFLCSGSDTVHHRTFFANKSGTVQIVWFEIIICETIYYNYLENDFYSHTQKGAKSKNSLAVDKDKQNQYNK